MRRIRSYLSEMNLQGADTLQEIGHKYWSVPSVMSTSQILKVCPFPVHVMTLAQTTSRMSVIQLADGSLWIHSAVEPTAQVRAQLDKLGPVRHIVIPNK